MKHGECPNLEYLHSYSTLMLLVCVNFGSNLHVFAKLRPAQAVQLQTFSHPVNDWNIFLRSTPHPVTVTTRIITFWVGNPYKPSFVTVTEWGVDPTSSILKMLMRIYGFNMIRYKWSAKNAISNTMNLGFSHFEGTTIILAFRVQRCNWLSSVACYHSQGDRWRFSTKTFQ